MADVFIDATNLILGRMASIVAKKVLNGDTVFILNAEKAVITGNKRSILDTYIRKRSIGGPLWGPFFPKRPDGIVRRTIRGMLPYKKDKGRKAFRRVKVYIGIPEEFKGKKLETLNEANVSKLKYQKYITIEELSKEIGGIK
ncbi:MAG: 50S ribosomal protein L13 [Candidatus Parvarchaeota archaeon]|nr:50S ribosomal protein L13 [Candidatus Jingweiarchaeum tengchongense]MCW1298301.1 50S ribosomal protein L13 [Candidatus Jingweiarchaeum tengchongense]MCW1300392.1 50S ribosomal protein L13 [Candidatus Jingweiarchaeum tengchongense]MCW1304763.1 50S ribosomal protein L13 [Candidatus Jingweiarchaeum tengchongense]MCW1305353.1 50S ribosomal protein L13 [Candidatus Jingweiarchaeum tengchongense]